MDSSDQISVSTMQMMILLFLFGALSGRGGKRIRERIVFPYQHDNSASNRLRTKRAFISAALFFSSDLLSVAGPEMRGALIYGLKCFANIELFAEKQVCISYFYRVGFTCRVPWCATI